MRRPDSEPSASSAIARSVGCVITHSPNGMPKPCFDLSMIASGRNPRSDSRKKWRSERPFNFCPGGTPSECSTTAASSIGNATSTSAAMHMRVTFGRSLSASVNLKS